jgi:hypothetical protein
MTVPAVPSSGRIARRLDFFVFLLTFIAVVFGLTAARFDFPVFSALSVAGPVGVCLAGLAYLRPSRLRRAIAALLGAVFAAGAWLLSVPPDPAEFLLRSGLSVSDSSSHDFVVDVTETERRTPEYVRVLLRIRSVDGALAPESLSALAYFDARSRLDPGDRIGFRAKWLEPS